MRIRHSFLHSLAAAMLAISLEAHSMATFVGIDQDGGADVRASTAVSDAARGFFLSLLPDARTENFEGFAIGLATPLDLTIPGIGTATLNGGPGVSIASVPDGLTDGFGRYPNSGTQFLLVESGSLTVTFGSRMSAFGFFGIDIGDFGADLKITINLADGGSESFALGVPPMLDGTRAFFGMIAQGAGEEFTSVVLQGTSVDPDVFAFDDMIVSAGQQACRVGCAVPEPATLAMLGLGLLGLGGRRRRLACPRDATTVA